MNIVSQIDRVVRNICLQLGRYGNQSPYLDGIARLVCSSFVDALTLPAAVPDLAPLPGPMLMAGMRSNQGGVYDTRTATRPAATPGPGDPGDPAHKTKECAAKQYHGMHGAPCAFHGGTDKFCPPGTTTGLWWRFNITGLGNVYYVDCCGLPITWKVWCRWAKEANWCAGRGGNIYTCTLTLLHSELKRDASGFADPAAHALFGPPPPPSP